jgi:hypothetical protein
MPDTLRLDLTREKHEGQLAGLSETTIEKAVAPESELEATGVGLR